MSRTERIKEELGWLKLVFGIFIAVDVSLIAWLAQNLNKASTPLLVTAAVCVILITVVLVWINRAAMQRFKELEKT
jgi:nitrate reductase gamma subunit